MTFILNGGGDATQTKRIDDTLAAELPRRTMLYVPHATSPDPWSFDQAEKWLRKHEAFDALQITTWQELGGRTYGELDDFDGIYLMGGNTFRLLSVLRETRFIDLLEKFAVSKRVICGISAGAIILGCDIGTASLGEEADENDVGITDLRGLDLVNGFHIHTHYEPADQAAIEDYARQEEGRKVACFPEDAGLIVRDSHSEVLGESDMVAFVGDEMILLPPGTKIATASQCSFHASRPEDL